MRWFNEPFESIKTIPAVVMRTWYGKVGLGVAVLTTVSIIALLNLIQLSNSPKRDPIEPRVYDQEISIPKIPGGAKAMISLWDIVIAQNEPLGVVSRWTAINLNDPGQLLIDLSSIHLFRNVERTGLFQYIPKAHTMDQCVEIVTICCGRTGRV